jgi:predicted anti-sigma-YlaC factor YlaD
MELIKDITCHQAVALVSDYLEGSLSRRDRRRLERHLKDCDACSAYLDQMRVTIALSGSVGPDDLSPDALSRLVDVFEQYQRDKSDG